MNDQKINIGTKSAYLRFCSGMAMLALGTARLIREPQRTSGTLLVLLGASKAAEGIARYCPMKEMMNGGAESVLNLEVSGGTLPTVQTSSDSGASNEATGGTGPVIQAFLYGGNDGMDSGQSAQSGQNESTSNNAGQTADQTQKKDPMQSI